MRLFICSIVAFVLWTASLSAQNAIPEIHSYLSQITNRGQFNGIVLVAQKGAIIYAHPFGYANFELKQQLTRDSVFELASVSKTFTAAAILMLRDRGQLKLDDDVRKYIPDLPYSGMQIRHLLTHTSGLPDYMVLFQQNWDQSKVASNQDVVQMLASIKPALRFSPGSKWEYSNTGYVLLASVIEKVSGTTYTSFLKTNIFEPAGMKNTQVVTAADSVPQNSVSAYVRKSMLTEEYAKPNEFPQFHFLISLANIVGDGSIHSTVDDLLKWDRVLYTEKILKHKTLKEAFTPINRKVSGLSAPLSSAAWSYGIGWFIRSGEQGSTEVWHTGGKPGVATYMIRNINLDQTIIILANTSNSAVVDAGNAIDGILAGRAYRLPKLSIARTIGPTVLQKGIDAAIQQYRDIKKNDPDNYNFGENELNQLGYTFIQSNQLAEAIRIFQLNVEEFPKSWNVYDSLGEGYMRNNQMDLAITNYRKSIEINPQNVNGSAMLEAINKKIAEKSR